jgi:methionine-rich copper-binding protein CopC
MTRLLRRTRNAAVLLIAVAATMIIAVAIMTATAPAASAHTTLVRSSPADQSSLATAPTIVTLTFDENIRMPSVILVTDAAGASVVQGKTMLVANNASARVSTGPSGDFAVAYRVVSADGHPVSGRLSFRVGTGSTGAPTGQVTATAGHHQESSSSTGGSRVIGMIAALALLGGVALLTVRRWAPDLWSSS